MTAFALTPDTFDGTDINSATYESKFLREHDVLSPVTREPVEVEIPGDYSFPTSPRSQPQSIILPLQVRLLTFTQVGLDAFKKLFDPLKGDVILTATDSTPITYRLTVRIVGVSSRQDSYDRFIVRLYVARPIWEQDSAPAPDVQTATTSPKTWQVTNAGTARAYPVIQLKPTVAKAHTVDYLRRWPVSIASRTEQEMMSTDGLPYPIDVADDSLDTATEAGASRLQADGDDLRVLIDGAEVRRDLDGVATATCKVWASASWPPKFSFTLAAAMPAVSPANGESFAVAEENGLALEPEQGFVMIGTETIYYGARTAQQYQQILRGSRGTTAAIHAIGATGYRREHDIYLLSDYTAATEPNGSGVDRKPVIDLALSTNLKHAYAGPLTAIGTYRPGQWVRRETKDHLLSPTLSFLDGAMPAFRDIAPSADALQFNGLELYIPCGIKAAAGAIEHDITVEDILTLEVLSRDFEGFESLLARYHSANDGVNQTITPARVLSRLRYRANPIVLTGLYSEDDESAIMLMASGWTSQQFEIDNDNQIRALVFRLQQLGTPDGDIQMLLAADATNLVGDSLIDPITIPMASVPTAPDYVGSRIETVLAIGYISAVKGKYWARLRRTLNTQGIVNLITTPAKLYTRGKLLLATGAGPWGPNNPSVIVDYPMIGDDTAVEWQTPSEAAASDNVYATHSVAAGKWKTSGLKATGFGFAVPGGTTIEGIKAEVECKADGDTGAVRVIAAGLFKAGVSVPIQDWPSCIITDAPGLADAYYTLGGPTKLWNTTWTPAEVNAATFGIWVQFMFTGGPARVFSVDHIRLTVYGRAGEEEIQQSAVFAVSGVPESAPNTDVPTGSGAEVSVDNIELTFDNATPRTPLIVRGTQETIYAFTQDVLSNDDTGQSITFQRPILALSDILEIDPYNKTVKLIPASANDPTIDVPWACVFSDEVDWFTLLAGVNNLRYVAGQGIGTVLITTAWRGAFG